MARRPVRSRRWRRAALVAASLAWPGAADAQNTPAGGGTAPAAADQCLSCHGPFGRPDNLEFPIIGGQNQAYLAAALRAYRDGKRTGEQAEMMISVVKELDDGTLDELAAFFSTLRSLR